MAQTKVLPTPKFTKSVIQEYRTDGYWLETFLADPNDKAPGLIGYGLTNGDISVFDNPLNGGPVGDAGQWKKYVVKQLDSPVAVALADCAGSGRKDIIICYDYGETFLTNNPNGGHISWLENPGRSGDGSLTEDWEKRYIGRWPAMHRLKAGYFTQRSVLEIIAMSVVHGPYDIDTAIPVMLFTRPEKSLEAIEWERSIIDDEHFTIIHDGAEKKFKSGNGLECLFIASREGINWLYWENKEWKTEHIHDGMPKQPGKDYFGSACVDVGRVEGDPAAYIMTIDPFHGTAVTALTKESTGLGSCHWIRHVLDTYGTPQQLKNEGEGPGHHVITADFDGDGDDECLVALFGPAPHQGVYYYKAIDIEKGIFAKWKVAEESAGRIAVGDFTGRGKLDFATIMYNVPKYYEAKDPKIHLYTHDFEIADVDAGMAAITTVWGGEPLVYVPKPTDIKNSQNIPLIEVAGYRIELEIIPPNSGTVAAEGEAIKVLLGECHDGPTAHRALDVPQFTKSSARVVTGIIKTKDEGVIFLRFIPIGENATDPQEWATAKEVPVRSLFEFSYPQLELPADLRFIKVEELPWGGGFQGVDFYNMSGIDFRFLDKTHLCHIQFWTIAKDTSAGVHNHSEDVFLEVHLCLSPGTGNGGMWRVKPGVVVDPDDPNSTPAEDFIRLPLDRLEQHGGFWHIDSAGKPVYKENGSVDYPYHKWQGGDEGTNIDIWTAFEFNPALTY